jgi:hypothetical protein
VQRILLVLALALLALPGQSLAAEFDAHTVQSPPNPVPAGTVVTYTTTVTNTSGDVWPPPPPFVDDVELDMFLSLYRSDRPAPNDYAAVTPSQGTCTKKATTPPSTDCTLGTMAAGASNTYTSTVQALVSMENRIAVLRCTSVNNCGTIVTADVDTIVTQPCIVPSLRGRRLASARRALKKANCTLGKVTRKSARPAKRGRVLSQRPSAGSKLPSGAKVALVVGRR